MELVLKLANVTLDIDRCLILILKTHLCTLLKRTILPKKSIINWKRTGKT